MGKIFVSKQQNKVYHIFYGDPDVIDGNTYIGSLSTNAPLGCKILTAEEQAEIAKLIGEIQWKR